MLALQRKLERDVMQNSRSRPVPAAKAAPMLLGETTGWSLNHAKAIEDRSPVRFGDVLVMKEIPGTGGFVTADAATLHCGVHQPPPDRSSPLEYGDYVFQVLPQGEYRCQRERDESRELRFVASHDEFAAADITLDINANAEMAENARMLTKVRAGQVRDPLRYGVTIELVHVRTGKRLRCHKTAAHRDGSCRRISLGDRGSPATLFTLKPRFKAQTENSVVFYGHSILFESTQLPGMFLHTSLVLLENRSMDVNQSKQVHVSRCIRSPPTFELNVSSEPSSYAFSLFSSCEPGNGAELRTSLNPFRLFHSQSDRFLAASCDPDKNDRSSALDPLDIFNTFTAARVFQPSSLRPRDAPSVPPAHRLRSVGRSIGISTPRSAASLFGTVRRAVSVVRSSELGAGSDRPIRFEVPEDEIIDLDCRTLPAHIPYLRSLNKDENGVSDSSNPSNYNAKQMWVFEAANRTISKPVCWGDSVRIRHTPSGRYLAVDTNEAMYQASDTEVWFRCYLVDDATEDADRLEKAALGTWAAPENLIFYLEGEGVTDGAKLPLQHSTVRIMHHWERSEDGLPDENLYLHSTFAEKPPCRASDGTKKKSTKSTRSEMVVFSTSRFAEDVFNLMPVSEAEAKLVHAVKSYLPHAMEYTRLLTESDFDLEDPEYALGLTRVLFSLIDLVTKGKLDLDQRDDWVKRATDTLPVEFSALFDAEANALAQGLCRDLKVMDAVFAMGVAPYTRGKARLNLHANPSLFVNPFGRDTVDSERMPRVRAVQKFVHVALQRMCAKNSASQLYFGRQLLADTNSSGEGSLGFGASAVSRTWMDSLKKQTEDPLGAAVTLRQLLSSNRVLFDAHCSPSLVHDFERMIRGQGPQPRLVSFLEAICKTEDKPVLVNQEMVLRMLWIEPEVRASLFVEVIPLHSSKPISPLPASYPASFIGKGDPAVDIFVRWSGCDDWEEQTSDLLWYSPKAMSIKESERKQAGHDGKSSPLVEIEMLCWVLEPESLCKKVTGVEFDAAKRVSATNFKRHKQLAQYFVAQLKVLVTMCYGRSCNVVGELEKSFPYTTVVAIATNDRLPSVVRAAALDLARVLFLDRYPQVPNCGRSSIPTEIWIFDGALGGKSESPPPFPAADASLPLIREARLDDDNALPGFHIGPLHRMARAEHKENQLLSFPSHFKFFLLRKCANDLINSFDGKMIHDQKSRNQMASAAVQLIDMLQSFGFQSTFAKVKEMVPGLVRLLDGRSDAHQMRRDPKEGLVPESFVPPSARYEESGNSQVVTIVKRHILDVLITVTHFRTQFRLGQLLLQFKKLVATPGLRADLLLCHAAMTSGEEGSAWARGLEVAGKGPLADALFDRFEDLFEEKGLDLGRLAFPISESGADWDEESGRDADRKMDEVLMDCLMYQDDALTAKALELLERTYTQRRLLIDTAGNVTLLQSPVFQAVPSPAVDTASGGVAGGGGGTGATTGPSPSVGSAEPGGVGSAGFESYGEISAALDYLAFAVHSAPAWAVSSDISKRSRDSSVEAESLRTARRLIAFLYQPSAAPATAPVASARPNAHHQNVLRAMGLVETLRAALAIDCNAAFKRQAAEIATANFRGRRAFDAPKMSTAAELDDMAQSREVLLGLVRALVEVLVVFVRFNSVNQAAVFAAALPDLQRLVRGVASPELRCAHAANAALRAKIDRDASVGAENVIIECLRGNCELVADRIPRDMFALFGALLEAAGDVSDSPLLDFFVIACSPHRLAGAVATFEPLQSTWRHNQDSTTSAVLQCDAAGSSSRLLAGALRCLHADGAEARGEGKAVAEAARPHRIVELLCVCIEGGNYAAAARLQNAGLCLEATVAALAARLAYVQVDAPRLRSVSVEAAPTKRRGVMFSQDTRYSTRNFSRSETGALAETTAQDEVSVCGDPLALRLAELMALQVETLVVDPKLLREPELWSAVALGVRCILGRVATLFDALGDAHTSDGSAFDRPSCTASEALYGDPGRDELLLLLPLAPLCLGLCRQLLQLAFSHGADEAFGVHANALGRGSAHRRSPDSLVATCQRLCSALSSSVGGRPHRPPWLPAGAAAMAAGLGEAARSLEALLTGGAPTPSLSGDDAPRPAVIFRSPVDDRGRPRSLGGTTAVRSASGVEMVPQVLARRGDGLLSTQSANPPWGSGAAAALEEPELSPDACLKAFVFALNQNERLQAKLMSRRFELVSVLEGEAAEAAQAEGQEHHSVEGRSSRPRALSRIGSEADLARPRRARSRSSFSLGLAAGGGRGSEGAGGKGRVPWPNVLRRLVEFATAHNYDGDDSSCARVYRILRGHVVKARLVYETVAGAHRVPHICETGEMSVAMSDAYHAAQDELDAAGCTTLVLAAISSHDDRSAASKDAMELLVEMLYGGNAVVQQSILNHCTSVDKEGRFLKHLRRRLHAAMAAVKRRTAALTGGLPQGQCVGPNAAAPPMSRELRGAHGDAASALGLLKWLVEGHHSGLQEYLRHQPASGFGQINLLEATLELLALQAKHRSALVGLLDDGGGTAAAELLEATLAAVAELAKGPCPGNQQAVAKHEGALLAVRNIVEFHLAPPHGQPHHRPLSASGQASDGSLGDGGLGDGFSDGLGFPLAQHGGAMAVHVAAARLRGRAVNVLAAVLEGRADTVLHGHIAAHIDCDLLRRFARDMVRFLNACTDGASGLSEHCWGNVGAAADEERRERRDWRALAVRSLVDLSNTRAELELVPQFLRGAGVSHDNGKLRELGGGGVAGSSAEMAAQWREAAAEQEKLMAATVASVEVRWNGRVELLYFPLPEYTEFLSSHSKAAFMKRVDISSPESRMKDLINAEPDFTAEMKRVSGSSSLRTLRSSPLCTTLSLSRLSLSLFSLLTLPNCANVFSLSLFLSGVPPGHGEPPFPLHPQAQDQPEAGAVRAACAPEPQHRHGS